MAALTVVPDPAPRLLDLDVMTAPRTLAELDQALADADTVERVASIHNTAKAAGGVTSEVLWERCSARWAQVEQGMTRERMLDS